MTAALRLNVVCAPSCSRPQISTPKVVADAEALQSLLGAAGVGGVTEISHRPVRKAWAKVFAHRFMPLVADAPIALTGNWRVVASGRDFGCLGIRSVAPVRFTVWVLVEDRVSGVKVGVVSTHMMPGGWRPSPTQRRYVPKILQRWAAHERRINRRRDWLAARSDVVVTLGDINHPGAFAFPGDVRLSDPGLVYIGVRAAHGVHVTHTKPKAHKQFADHPSQSTVLTVRKVA